MQVNSKKAEMKKNTTAHSTRVPKLEILCGALLEQLEYVRTYMHICMHRYQNLSRLDLLVLKTSSEDERMLHEC
jgi:hypothetical protein